MELQERLHRYGKLCIRPMMLQFSTFRRLGYGGYLRKWEGIFSFSFFYKRLWMCGRNIEYMEWLWERGPKVKLHWKTFCTRLWIFVLFCFFLEKAMATHYITLAWKIPWTEEPGGLQSMGSLRVGDTEWLHFHFSLLCNGEGNGNPLQCSCLENLRDGRAWWAAIYGVIQSQTRLKRLSSSSMEFLIGKWHDSYYFIEKFCK